MFSKESVTSFSIASEKHDRRNCINTMGGKKAAGVVQEGINFLACFDLHNTAYIKRDIILLLFSEYLFLCLS